METPTQEREGPRLDFDLHHRPHPHWQELEGREVERVASHCIEDHHGADEDLEGDLLPKAEPVFGIHPREHSVADGDWLKRTAGFGGRAASGERSGRMPKRHPPSVDPALTRPFVSGEREAASLFRRREADILCDEREIHTTARRRQSGSPFITRW